MVSGCQLIDVLDQGGCEVDEKPDGHSETRIGLVKFGRAWKVLPRRAPPLPVPIRLTPLTPAPGALFARVHPVPFPRFDLDDSACASLPVIEADVLKQERTAQYDSFAHIRHARAGTQADPLQVSLDVPAIVDDDGLTIATALDAAKAIQADATGETRCDLHPGAGASTNGTAKQITYDWRAELRREYDEARAAIARRRAKSDDSLSDPCLEEHAATTNQTHGAPVSRSSPTDRSRPRPLLQPLLFYRRMTSGVPSGIRKAVLAAGIVLILAMRWSDAPDGGVAQARAAHVPNKTQHAVSILGGEWSQHWGARSARQTRRTISVYRTPFPLTDCRIELAGRIERQALAWIFRAQDARNYYVMKLEEERSGKQQAHALVRFAIIDGKETRRTRIPLPALKKSFGTMLHVRMEIVGDTFTTFVEDRVADMWVDDQLTRGLVGLLHERGERAIITGFRIAALQ